MTVFQDVFTNDEMMSELFEYELCYHDAVMKVKSSYKRKGDIGHAFSGDEEGAGEEGAGDGDEPVEKVIDVAHNFNLVETSFGISDFVDYLRNQIKKIKTWLEANGADRVDDFMKGADEFFKFVRQEREDKFDEFTFYTGASESMDGSIVISYWEDDTAPGPVFCFFKDSLKEVEH